MPKTLNGASVTLALSGLCLVAFWLVSALLPPSSETVILWMPERLAEEPRMGARIPVLVIVAAVQAMLCVVVRTGSNPVRVVLAMTSAVTGSGALLAVVFFLLDYLDLTERAALLGGQVRLQGWGMIAIAVAVLAFVSTVIGLLLLYWPTTNAYIRHVRRLRAQARSGGPQD